MGWDGMGMGWNERDGLSLGGLRTDFFYTARKKRFDKRGETSITYGPNSASSEAPVWGLDQIVSLQQRL